MYKYFFKRLIDIFIALLALPILVLVTIVVSPLIFFTDKGPVFYNAKRIGKRGKIFRMFKFRSMYVNSSDIRNEDGSTFNSDRDPRVTKIGRFMRKTSIDELPQILNVLIGDMSFIGPRPTIGHICYDELSGVKRKRYDVRPGITGYAQAYYRNSIPQEQKFVLDAYYVDNLNFTMDVKIFYKTILSVIKRENIFVGKTNL